MIQALITFVVLFFFVRWAWKFWGKGFSEKLTKEIKHDEELRDSLKLKIEALDKEAKELKEATDELKISEQLELIQTQRDEREAELKEINKKIQNR
jgi:hypothetical protein